MSTKVVPEPRRMEREQMEKIEIEKKGQNHGWKRKGE